MERVKAERLGHRPELDGLRAFACLAVFVCHVHRPWLPGGGWVGVTVFFTLSGYLITSLLLEERDRTGGVSLRRFYQRRARRLLPALGFLLLAVTALAPLLGDAKTLRAVPWAGLYAGNLASNDQMSWLTHTWSLAVEEHFYVVWPLVFVAVWRFARSHLLAVTVAAAGASMVWRFWLAAGGASYERLQRGTDVRAESILVGCVLAVWVYQRRPLPRLRWLAVVVVPFLVFDPLDHRYVGTVGFTAVSLLTAATIAAWRHHPPTVPAAAVTFGKRTYGFYLWHIIVLWVIHEQGWQFSPVELLVVAGAGTLGITWLSWTLIERRWLYDARSSSTPSSAASLASVSPASAATRSTMIVFNPPEATTAIEVSKVVTFSVPATGAATVAGVPVDEAAVNELPSVAVL